MLLLVLAWVLLKNTPISLRLLSFGVMVGVLAMAWMHPVVKQRVEITKTHYDLYMNQTDSRHWSKGTSVGSRIQMWKASWKIFQDNPLVGVGLGGYDKAAREGREGYGVGSPAYWFYHPHNQYLSALSTRGLPGLVMLLCVLLVPVYYVFLNKPDDPARYSAEAIIIYLICLSYVIFGLSDVPLEGKATIIFYVVFVAWLLSELDRDSGKERLKERAE